jgi:hypothetical protein
MLPVKARHVIYPIPLKEARRVDACEGAGSQFYTLEVTSIVCGPGLTIMDYSCEREISKGFNGTYIC